MRRVTLALLLCVLAALAASGRVVVWVSASGMMPFQLTEGARAGFTKGLEEAGLSPVSSTEVISVNMTVDPQSAEDLSSLAAALNSDYVAVIEVVNDGRDFLMSGRLYEGYTGELHEGDTALVDQISNASRLAERIARRLAEGLPTCGPFVEIARDGATATLALGSSQDVRRYDYGWVYRYGEPMIHPDTGKSLGVGIEIVGLLRVDNVRGPAVSSVTLSDTFGNLRYRATDRVRMFTTADYRAENIHRGALVPFVDFGFGDLFDLPYIVVPDPDEPDKPEVDKTITGVRLELAEVRNLDYSPVDLDYADGRVYVLGDDDKVHLYRADLTPDRSLNVGSAEAIAVHKGRLYVSDSWSSTITSHALGASGLSDARVINRDISAVKLVSGADGNLWTTAFSYSAGWSFYTYPALRLSENGTVVEARELDRSSSMKSLAVDPEGTVYYATSFGPVRGKTSGGNSFERASGTAKNPEAVATDNNGLLYVIDSREGLMVFDPQGNLLGSWKGGGVMDLRHIDGIICGDGSCYLISNWNEVLVRIDATFEYAR